MYKLYGNSNKYNSVYEKNMNSYQILLDLDPEILI